MGPVDATERIRAEASGHSLECTAESLDLQAFSACGVLVIRDLLPDAEALQIAEDWKAVAWDANGSRALDYNPVNSTAVPDSLIAFSRSARVVRLLEPIFGIPLGLFNRRVVAKDGAYTGSIFLHQDSGYHKGTLSKASLFLALTPVQAQSGGLEFWLGTHRFGYLGDAGEIDGSVLPPDWPRLSPLLNPGDAVIMHSGLWHRSGPNTSGTERILTDLQYQAGMDASSLEILWPDHWQEQTSPVLLTAGTLLSRGRVSTIQRLDQRVKELEAERALRADAADLQAAAAPDVST